MRGVGVGGVRNEQYRRLLLFKIRFDNVHILIIPETTGIERKAQEMCTSTKKGSFAGGLSFTDLHSLRRRCIRYVRTVSSSGEGMRAAEERLICALRDLPAP